MKKLIKLMLLAGVISLFVACNLKDTSASDDQTDDSPYTPSIDVKVYTLEEGKHFKDKEVIVFDKNDDPECYYYNLEAYKDVKNTNDVIQFTLKNETAIDTNYKIHLAFVDSKDILDYTLLESGQSITYTFKIEDLITFRNKDFDPFKLEIFSDTTISMTDAKILTVES